MHFKTGVNLTSNLSKQMFSLSGNEQTLTVLVYEGSCNKIQTTIICFLLVQIQ